MPSKGLSAHGCGLFASCLIRSSERLTVLRISLLTLVLIGVVVAPKPAKAANFFWDTGACAANYFDNSSCWSGGQPPADLDRVFIGSVSPTTVQWDSATVSQWQLFTGSVSPLVTNSTLELSTGAVDFVLSDGTGETYKLLDNVFVFFNGSLTFNSYMTLEVGNAVNIGFGGTFTTTGTRSQLNSSILSVGDTDNGTLNILNGGSVTSADSSIGENVGSTGVATVDGMGSSWLNSGSLIVGDAGDGTLNIRNGGSVSNTFARIGENVGSTGAVTIGGSSGGFKATLVVGDDMAIGGSAGGTANVTINTGGLLQVANVLKVWSQGTLNLNGGTIKVDSTDVDNEGSFFYNSGTFHLTDVLGYSVGANSGPVDVLLGSSSHVNLFNGKNLIVDNSLSIPAATLLTVNGGTVNANTIVNVGLVRSTNSTLTTTGGLANTTDLILNDTTIEGTVDNFGGSTVTVLGTVDFNGLVSGSGNFFGPGTANFNGGMALGASPAEVSFEGNVVLGASNTLFAELGGIVPGDEFDSIDIAGTATLAGALDISLLGGFTPSLGDTFEIITALGGVTGTFDSTLLPDLGSLLAMDVLYDTNNVALVVAPALPGDFDLNGKVDGFDFLTWQRDTSIGALVDWESNYGSVAPLAAATASVPEPSSLLLVAMACLAGCCRNRRI